MEHSKEAFLAKLKDLQSEDLDFIIGKIEEISGNDPELFPKDIFPEGIIRPDCARVKYLTSPEKHNELIGYLQKQKFPFYRDIRIFPLGIIRPDLFETHISIERKSYHST